MIGLNREDYIVITIWKILQESGDFTWRVSDCEELVEDCSLEMKIITKVNGKEVLWSLYTLRFTILKSIVVPERLVKIVCV